MKKKIVFVCTGNCSRSVMAEALMRSLAEANGLHLEITSGGTHAKPGMRPTPECVNILQQRGLRVPERGAQVCSRGTFENADMILVMEKFHRDSLLSRFPETEEKI